MSYDLYCYRPTSDVADLAEAQALIEDTNSEHSPMAKEMGVETRDRIAAALIQHNPRLERFAPDYAKIAAAQKITQYEARTQFRHIELNTPEEDIAVQIVVYEDHVDIEVPYWYKNERAKRVFAEISDYARVIRRAAGFFVYDPQTNIAFDPEQVDVAGQSEYEKIVDELPELVRALEKEKKPWWKLW